MAFDVSTIGRTYDARIADDIVRNILSTLETLRPNLTLRNSSPEVIYAEAVALAIEDVVQAVNWIVTTVEEALLAQMYGIARNPGLPASGEVTITFDSNVATTIPAGTTFLMREYNTEVATTTDVHVVGVDIATLSVRSTTATTLLNGVGDEAAIDVLTAIPNILTVEVSHAFSGGADAEDDAAFLARVRNRLARVSTSLILPDHFTSYVLEDGLAINAITIPAWDGVDVEEAGTIGQHLTTVVYANGSTLIESERSRLKKAMQQITAEGVLIHVEDPVLVPIDVTVTVGARPGLSAQSVQAAVVDTLEQYLRPETWTYGAKVRATTLISRIASLNSVDYVDELFAPSDDVDLAPNELAVPGTISVSVI